MINTPKTNRIMISQFVIGAIGLGIPSTVLGESFSLPFQKVQTYGETILPPTKTYHRGRAQIGEVDQEVRQFTYCVVQS
jgi:hypothetical protein